jgi:hypothetical protein
MQATRYVVTNIRAVSRTLDDLPPIASDQELLEWAHSLLHDAPEHPDRAPTPGPARPVAEHEGTSLTLEELLLDIEIRATEVYERAHA